MTKLAPILILALGLAALGEGIALWRLGSRVTRLETSVREAPSPRRTADERPRPVPGADGVAAKVVLDERLTALERHRDEVVARLPGLGDDATATGAPRTDGPAAAPDLEARVQEVVDRRLDERLGKNEKSGGDEEKKPSIAELSAAVKMTEEQEDASTRFIDEGKRETFELLSIPRADGTSLAVDLVDALKASPDEAGRKTALEGWFVKLMTEKIPGRDQTVLGEIMRIQKSTWGRIETALEGDQMKKLKRMGIDILEVKTGYEPFEALMESR